MVIKVELHSHTSDDPEDRIAHSAEMLVDRAVAFGYGALAITLHDRWFHDERVFAYAATRGLTLIPAIERTVDGRHVLLINAPAHAGQTVGFDSLRQLKRDAPSMLVVAPHPFFPLGHSLGGALLGHQADLWDAVEINGFYTRTVDFNRRAVSWATARGLPLVGNCDVHQLDQLGTTFSLVDVQGPTTPDSVCEAIRSGRVAVRSRPLSHWQALRIATRAVLSSATRRPW
jgi:predicted metal-dependent phosphoesterase TrpH